MAVYKLRKALMMLLCLCTAAAQSQQPSQTVHADEIAPYRIGDGVSAPVPVYHPDPELPPGAPEYWFDVRVTLTIVINRDGTVRRAAVIAGAPEAGGLGQKAIEAVRSWRFEPGMKNGSPVPTITNVQVQFKNRTDDPRKLSDWPIAYEAPVVATANVCFEILAADSRSGTGSGTTVWYFVSSSHAVNVQVAFDGNQTYGTPDRTTAVSSRVPLEAGSHTLTIATSEPVDSLRVRLVDASAANRLSLRHTTDCVPQQGNTRGGAVRTENSGWDAVPQNRAAFRVGSGVSAPQLIDKREPEYSEEARQSKMQGSEVLSLVVDTDGRPVDIQVLGSAGMGFDEKAIEAILQWRFRPGMKDGKPVPVRSQIEVNFRLL